MSTKNRNRRRDSRRWSRVKNTIHPKYCSVPIRLSVEDLQNAPSMAEFIEKKYDAIPAEARLGTGEIMHPFFVGLRDKARAIGFDCSGGHTIFEPIKYTD